MIQNDQSEKKIMNCLSKSITFSHKTWPSVVCIAFHARNNRPIPWAIEENFHLARHPIFHAQNFHRSHADVFAVQIYF